MGILQKSPDLIYGSPAELALGITRIVERYTGLGKFPIPIPPFFKWGRLRGGAVKFASTAEFIQRALLLTANTALRMTTDFATDKTKKAQSLMNDIYGIDIAKVVDDAVRWSLTDADLTLIAFRNKTQEIGEFYRDVYYIGLSKNRSLAERYDAEYTKQIERVNQSLESVLKETKQFSSGGGSFFNLDFLGLKDIGTMAKVLTFAIPVGVAAFFIVPMIAPKRRR